MKESNMKRIAYSIVVILMAAGTGFPQQATQSVPLAEGLRLKYNVIKSRLTMAADTMPDAGYAFKPAPDTRSFAQLLAHAANRNLLWCSALKGESDPNKGNDIQEKSEKADVPKAEIVKALANSFAYCDGVISAQTDASLAKIVTQGPDKRARGLFVSGIIAHLNEVWGRESVYLSLKGLPTPE
jgi:hypothetical protein